MTGVGGALGPVRGNPLRPILLGLAGVVGLSALVAVGLLVVDPIWALAAAIFGLTGVISIAIAVPFSRVYARDMRRLLAGAYWVRWRYDRDEWERFADQEWARARREARFGAAASVILALGAGVLLAVLGAGWTAAILAAGVLLVAGLAVSGGIWLAGRARHARRAGEAGNVTIGPLGVHHPGRYVPLRGFNLRLADVAVEPGSPAALRFRTASLGRYGTRTHEARVSVPRGREADAKALAERFRSEVAGT